ncbi:CcdC protein domain-containing protein [Streptomyces sp. NBC_00083]|uniref:CcdC protein domain-containing protein n=1 Tax=Streptomyces sp. NBC_00083 TaxID=2975647 RepID=UPI0022541EB0|nr:CcdC protein domain-containing protein [Streptomyces sp. NBC_00083]MCX5386131.1 DUF1453 family protein [Streptomyces sp. NBC_00083]
MSLVNVLVALAVVALILARQFKPQQIGGGRRWWLIPAALMFFAVKDGGLVDPHHQAASATLLGAEVLIGVLMGVGWAWTSKTWTEADGTTWTRGTRATAGIWVLGIVLRVGLAGLGALAGIHLGTGAILLALAASLLVRGAIMMWRIQSAAPSYGVAAAGTVRAGAGPARQMWKDRV